MKKFLLSALLVGSLFAANAQDSEFKPAGKDWTFEVTYNPQGATLLSTPFQFSYLRGRYFLSPTTAIRTGLAIDVTSTNKEIAKNATQNVDGLTEKTSSIIIDLRPGFEKHFAGTERLSPYVGAELAIQLKTASSEVTNDPNGGTSTTQKITGSTSLTRNGINADNSGFFRLGLNGVIGADYYIVKHVFVGMEAGVSLISLDTPSEVTFNAGGQGAQDVKIVPGASTTKILSPYLNAGVRFGYRF